MSALAPGPDPAADVPAHPGLGEAFRYWLRLGFISFGGPAGQIAIMHQDLVERRRWISERRFLHALNYCMVLPGPEAQQLAIYIGWLLHRTWGGIIAGALFVLPSLLLLALLSYLYVAYSDVSLVQDIFTGLKPAVVAIVLFAAWRLGTRALRNAALWSIAAAAFVAIFVFAVPFPYIVLAAAGLGVIGGRLLPAHFHLGAAHGTAPAGAGAAVIGDDDAPLPHTRFDRGHLLRLLAIALVLWLLLMAVLGGSGLQALGWFFTKAALITFGGAYAVLPYLYQGGVETHQWLTGEQMMDGLALGETTPGPLIIVVAFVGFLGGWTGQFFGADLPVLSALAGAFVATFCTFLPSFVFILAGGPLVESTRGELTFTAPLTGITAAVVGVIFNLAAFFAWHAFWPDATVAAPFSGPFDAVALVIAVVCFIALVRFKADILKVILAAGLAGLLLGL